MPASVAQLLLDSRLAPHFVFTPVSKPTTQIGQLSDFVSINPFEVLNKTTNTSCASDVCSTKSCC